MPPPARADNPFVRAIALVLAVARRRRFRVALLRDYYRLFDREPDLEGLLDEFRIR